MQQEQFTEIREVRVNYLPTAVKRFPINRPTHVAEFVRSVLPDNSREHFVALYLDGSHYVASYSVISTGLANFTTVHPREVFQRAVVSGACAVAFAHNHPSESTEPSREDQATTERLRKAGEILGIKVLDHVIVTDKEHLSMAAEGWRAL